MHKLFDCKDKLRRASDGFKSMRFIVP